jgi:hypothetical protein
VEGRRLKAQSSRLKAQRKKVVGILRWKAESESWNMCPVKIDTDDIDIFLSEVVSVFIGVCQWPII